jgi:hypothetical protein
MMRKVKESVLSRDQLMSYLRYDGETGLMYWRCDRGVVKRGALAGMINPQGYRKVTINKRIYLVHRLAWLIGSGKWPDDEIDHINGIRSDNRIENLRAVGRKTNGKNLGLFATNSSGYCGVSIWKNKKGKMYFRGTVTGSVDGKRKTLSEKKFSIEKHTFYGAKLMAHEYAVAKRSEYDFHENHGTDRSIEQEMRAQQ